MDFKVAAKWTKEVTRSDRTLSGLYSIAAGLVTLAAAVVEASENISGRKKGVEEELDIEK